MPQLKIGLFLTLVLAVIHSAKFKWIVPRYTISAEEFVKESSKPKGLPELTCHSSVGSSIDEVAMMEMSEGGGVGNAAFDATGDDLDSRQQQATQKVYNFITFSA